MTETHSIVSDIAHLNALERRVIDRFIHRQRLTQDISQAPRSIGDRIADRVAAFGGSWTFIFLALAAIAAWMLANGGTGRPFDPYPYILLNLVLSCLAALQAPVIMMSQNRQAAHDRLDAQHDYEVNTKAELEILALQSQLDEIREKWVELMNVQEQQLGLLAQLVSGRSS